MASTAFAALASSGITQADPGFIQLPMALAQPAVIESLPAVDQPDVADPAVNNPTVNNPTPTRAISLASLVASQPQSAELPRELNCLAGAIYFESKSESLSGQLAVGRVVVARSKSGRFPNSYCGVVFQPSQFSFVRGGGMPGIARGSQQWRNAVAVAQIAHAGSWRSPVEGALYFHAAFVSPAWRLAKVGRIENHVFYR
ncbi:MAG: cell wall hydrolase [Novosphingobium sp.]